jgi:hypothetical protein
MTTTTTTTTNTVYDDKIETAKLAPSQSKETKQQPRWLLMINSGLCVLALDLPTVPMATLLTCKVLIPSEH